MLVNLQDMTLTIDYPPLLPDTMQMSNLEFEKEARLAMGVKLFEMKKLSSGLAAQLAGLDRVSFLMQLQRFSVSAINISAEELHEDAKNA